MPDTRQVNSGREAFDRGDWVAAYEAFARSEGELPLSAADLEAWSTAAYLLGRDDEFVKLLDAAHQRHLDHGDTLRAARCTSWLALNLAAAGAQAPASGWLSRTRRLLSGASEDTVEGGYLALAEALAAVQRGDFTAVVSYAERAVQAGSRFHDPDLEALAVHILGRAELRRSRVDEGLALLDEAMATVSSRVTSPFVIGVVYCSVIDACRAIFSLRRAHEWTEALGRWCETQPGLVAFQGDCCVARAEMLVLRGAWTDAATEAQRATEKVALWAAPRISSAAKYQLAEVHRLRGDMPTAERIYEEVDRDGGPAYPGLALLWLARGESELAYRTLVRKLEAARDPLRRVRLIPALVEAGAALLRGSDLGEREEVQAELRTAATELGRVAQVYRSRALRAMADEAKGWVDLTLGEPETAVGHLRSAAETWLSLAAPYHAARTRATLGRTLVSLGEADEGQRELAAARAVFEELGALTDLEGMEHGDGPADQLLSSRELEVLRTLAGGESNKAIADALGISERTVERHVSNIFDKLEVRSRTEAAAYAFRNRLV